MTLLSGGLDSATCLAIARADGTELFALSVEYGQRHSAEIDASKRVAKALDVKEHKFIRVDLNAIGGSALTDDIAVPKDRDESAMADIPVTYVPARNTVLLALALGYAEVVGAEAIYAGVNAVDYSGYPDCRPEYVAAFQNLARLATKAGVEGRPIEIRTPLIHLTKPEIIRRGLELGVDYGITHSCYDPIDTAMGPQACGRCDACIIRQRAFASLGMTDPALSAAP